MFKNKFHSIIFLTSLVISQAGFSQKNNLPDFTSLVEETGAAVVNITARQNAKELTRRERSQREDMLERFFGVPQYPQERDSVAGGSGFIISEDGYILTNRHVIHDADEILVTLIDRREFDAKLIGEDEASDVALLKVDAKNLPVLKVGDSNNLKIGEWVMAIGSPLSFEHSVTKGIVSAKGRDLGRQQYVPYIQTDVPINRGNSGGPLINMNAEVVGINTIIVSNTGGYMGLSFSIPINTAMSVAEQLKSGGKVQRGLLGVNIEPVTQKMADYLGLKKPQGALVNNVNKGSSAEKAGIEVQDVIVKFNGQKVETSASLPPLVGSVMPGTKVEVGVIRDGKRINLEAVLDGLTDNEVALSSNGDSPTSKLDLGFEVANLNDDEKDDNDVNNGVLVKEITNRDINRSGLREGDVIIKMGKTPVKNVKHFKKLLSELEKDKPIVLLVKQAGVNRFIVIERN